MKYLGKSTDCPRGADVKKQELPLPQPGTNEYRRYYNHREEERIERDGIDAGTGEPQAERVVKLPTADFVAVSCEHEPTDEEWTECLTANGFTSKEIKTILAGK